MALLLAYSIFILAFLLSERILISFRERLCPAKGTISQPLPQEVAATLLSGSGSAGCNVRKGFSRGAGSAHPCSFPSPFFLPTAWKLDMKAEALAAAL